MSRFSGKSSHLSRSIRLLLTFCMLVNLMGIPSPQPAQAVEGNAQGNSGGSDARGKNNTPFSGSSLGTDLFTGNATFSVPIALAPGRVGPTPPLSLSYSSEGRNGWLGLGWQLSAGRIYRIGAGGKVPTHTTEDEFVLSVPGVGSKLIDAGTGDPDDMVTTQESLLKIRRDGAANQWIVTGPDGTTYEFGTTDDSRIESILYNDDSPAGYGTYRLGSGFDETRSWMLARVTDIMGNYAEFTYLEDQDLATGGDVYPATVRYNMNDAGDNSVVREVEFVLEDRPDDQLSFATGSKVFGDKRLASILVWANDNATHVNTDVVRQYRLEYEPDDVAERDAGVLEWKSPYSRLVRVQEFGTDALNPDLTDNVAAVGRPPYLFDYTEQAPGFDPVDNAQYHLPEPIILGTQPQRFHFGARLADINADGFPDFVKSGWKLGPQIDTWQWQVIHDKTVYLADQNGGWDLQPSSLDPPLVFTDDNFYGYIDLQEPNILYDYGVQLFDINGDLLPDQVQFASDTYGNGAILRNVHLNQGPGQGWSPTSDPAWDANLPHEFLRSFYDAYIYDRDRGTRFGDFNNDGLADVISAMSDADFTTGNPPPTDWLLPPSLKWNNGDGTWDRVQLDRSYVYGVCTLERVRWFPCKSIRVQWMVLRNQLV